MIVIDTSVVIALMNRRDPVHELSFSWISEIREELVTTPIVLAEIDHLLTRLGGPNVVRAFYQDLSRGAYIVDWSDRALHDTLMVASRYSKYQIGLADASLIALAAKIGTVKVATLDERHFRVVQPLTGEPAFVLYPRDAT